MIVYPAGHPKARSGELVEEIIRLSKILNGYTEASEMLNTACYNYIDEMIKANALMRQSRGL